MMEPTIFYSSCSNFHLLLYSVKLILPNFNPHILTILGNMMDRFFRGCPEVAEVEPCTPSRRLCAIDAFTRSDETLVAGATQLSAGIACNQLFASWRLEFWAKLRLRGSRAPRAWDF